MSLRGGQDGRRGNPSCLGECRRRCLFDYRVTVDRQGLCPRDDKGGIFTMKGVKIKGFLILSWRGGSLSDRRGNPSCLGESGKVGGSFTEGQWIAAGFQPSRCQKLEKRNGQSLCFTLHPSIFSLLLLTFLETYTEAHVAAAETGGVADALSRTQVHPGVVPGTTPLDPMRARDWT